MIDIFLGFDPGGRGGRGKEPKFGWSICEGGPRKPRLFCSGTAGYAREVYDRVLERLPEDSRVRASGIDAPLLWPICEWGRQVDRIVCETLRNNGDMRTSVQHINSLAGAGLAQGVLLAEILHQDPELRSPITEAHPKALLTVLETSRRDLGNLVRDAVIPPGADQEHREDATLAAYAAWAMHNRRPGWRNLLISETHPLYSPYPRETDISYWMPIPA